MAPEVDNKFLAKASDVLKKKKKDKTKISKL